MNVDKKPNSWKSITVDSAGNKKYPKGTIFTRVKFETSEKTGAPVAFLAFDKKTRKFYGVRGDTDVNKMVCVLDPAVTEPVLLNVLYDVALIKTQHKYIVIEANVRQFKATVSETYVGKAVYIVTVSFGNKTIVFDPKDGRSSSVKTIEGVCELLRKRVDVENCEDVIAEFEVAAARMLKLMKQDGFYVKTP